MKHSCSVIGYAILAAVLLTSGVGLAQPNSPDAALTAALEAAQKDDHVGAVNLCLPVLGKLGKDKLPKAYKVLGYSFKQLGLLPEAWHFLKLHISVSGGDNEVVLGWILEVETTLTKTHGLVKINLDPPSAVAHVPVSAASQVQAKKVDVTGPSFEWWFKPGTTEILVEAASYNSSLASIVVVVGPKNNPANVRLDRAVATMDSLNDKPPVIVDSADEGGSKIPAYSLWIAGGAITLAGGITYAIAYDRNETAHDKYTNETSFPDVVAAQGLYDSAYNNDVEPLATASYVMWGIGGAALIAGTVMWFLTEPETSSSAVSADDDSGPATTVTPLVMPGGFGATLTW